MDMKTLVWDSKLEANALDTVKAGNGNMVHKLNSGSMGQILAIGDEDKFKHVFVGGWICEVPSYLGQYASECATEAQGFDHQGQVGHADILKSADYSKIGCACVQKVWSCDLA
ncbi:hypothetical protein GQ44DRAFT_625593 [Phaeosphaeriaceae sp. PMI808]|nr:hypothetical protein GQ44DRAFT_625593 [Phaeosphaeriaceae sp. PMI808]